MELPVTTPSPDHGEFDQMCAEVDEFEPLPTLAATPYDADDADEADEAETPLDGQILAGLVSPC